MVRIWLFFIGNFLFFMPIFLSAYSVIDIKNFKIYFCIKIFGLSVFGGYVTFCVDSIFIHISNKKAIIVKITDALKKPKNIFNLNLYSILLFKTKTITSLECSNGAILKLLFFCIVNNTILPIVNNNKKYLRIKNDVVFSEKNKNKVIFFKICAVTNMFSINLFLTKKFLESINFAKRKKQY